MENEKLPIADLGVKQVPASEAIDGGNQPLAGTATTKPVLNYPRNEELVIQCVINSEAEGYALLRALQIVVNTFGATTCTQLVTKLENKPQLADTVRKYIPIVLAM
jgi:hypothetical protein